jgi:hypothetical protein
VAGLVSMNPLEVGSVVAVRVAVYLLACCSSLLAGAQLDVLVGNTHSLTHSLKSLLQKQS